MFDRRSSLLFAVALVGTLSFSLTSVATGVVTGGQWARDIHDGAPVGTAADLAHAQVVAYFIQLANPSDEPVALTVVWRVNGEETAPVQLDTNWHATWVFHAVQNDTRELEISVRDAHGAVLHTDRMTFQRPSVGSQPPAHGAQPAR